ncbi:T9SS-dependent M36 family metallopeptidase [Flavobacterium ponti]|uniref:T9SS-dependent M36 family metallopeptidase n=1 Tax=Flavobacterium ponti TaxID=665133 RepID=A0ABV9P9C7_9FLAO
MKKSLLLLFLFTISLGFSQEPIAKIQEYLTKNKTKFELTNQDISDWTIESKTNSDATKIDNYFIKQRHQGIEVFQSNSNVWIKNGEVINALLAFVPNLSQKVNAISPSVTVLDALSNARQLVNDNSVNSQIIETISANEFKLSNGNQIDSPVLAELVYQFNEEDKTVRLAWDLNFYSQDSNHLWSIRIDAITNQLLEKHDWVISCTFGDANHKNHNHQKEFFFSKLGFNEFNNTILNPQSGSYRVIPYNYESPNHITRQLIANPHNTTASPYGWHDVNGVAGNEFTDTRGNNVYAQEDADGNNGTGASPSGGAGLLFDFPYGGTGVQPATYLDAATTNLFYMNNIMHDVWYQYGFNEINGNFQKNNYGKGGITSFLGDAVFADSQDGSSTNNANFSTPVDGANPRMQMFLWTYGPTPKYLTINSPSAIAGDYTVANNTFSPGNVPLPAAPGLTSDFVLYQDATGVNEACTAATNAAQLNGKIAVIKRGNCDFVLKVKNAQLAGAVAVIMLNNDTANPNTLVGMSGSDATITIPAIFATYNQGQAILAQMSSGTVNGTIKNDVVSFVNTDGDFDNVVIAHEYGHGISTRLAGGPSNSSCLSNYEAMGEGWSDWYGLMMQLKAGDVGTDPKTIGTFVAGQSVNGGGIRQYPYSTDMAINPLTFIDSNEPIPTDPSNTGYRYVIGEFWATTLWDLTWAYINKYGFDPNIYNGTGGNNKVMQLVLDGLKLQPCNPGIVAGRNALIAADQATTGGQDYCLIWEVFARRGVGVNASSGSNNNPNDQIQDFTEPSPGPNCVLQASYFDNDDMIKVFPNPSNGLLNIAIAKYNGKLNIELYDINGRKVFSQNMNDFNAEKTINLQSIQSGIYLLKLDGDDLSYTKKLIIN